MTFPGLWSNTCCSHPLATLDERDGSLGAKRAARRKLGHELGIPEGQCDIQDMAFLGRILYAAPCSQKWGEHELDYILFLRKKGSGETKSRTCEFYFISLPLVSFFV